MIFIFYDENFHEEKIKNDQATTNLEFGTFEDFEYFQQHTYLIGHEPSLKTSAYLQNKKKKMFFNIKKSIHIFYTEIRIESIVKESLVFGCFEFSGKILLGIL